MARLTAQPATARRLIIDNIDALQSEKCGNADTSFDESETLESIPVFTWTIVERTHDRSAS
jgi:hypothetical protein